MCFALAASASKLEKDAVKIEHDLKNEGDNSMENLAKLMSRVRRGQYPGSGITPGKSSKFWLKRCSPCWFAVEKLLKKKPTKPDNGDAEVDDILEDGEAEITPSGEIKFSSGHCAKLMSRVKPGQLPDTGIAPGKSPKFWQKKCQPCWYAVKKLLKKKPAKPTSAEANLDDEDDYVSDMDDLEEDKISKEIVKYLRRRGGYYGGLGGLLGGLGGLYGGLAGLYGGYLGYLLG